MSVLRPWQKGPVSSELLHQLYAELRTVLKVCDRLAELGFTASPSTVHIWLRSAGVPMRKKGNDGQQDRYLEARARKARGEVPVRKRAVQARLPSTLRRVQCPQGRHWRGAVIACVASEDGQCHTCDRGYEASLDLILNTSVEATLSLYNSRRKGSRPPVNE